MFCSFLLLLLLFAVAGGTHIGEVVKNPRKWSRHDPEVVHDPGHPQKQQELCRFQVESKSHFASEISIRWAVSKLMGFSLFGAISEILPSYFLESMIIHANKKSTRKIPSSAWLGRGHWSFHRRVRVREVLNLQLALGTSEITVVLWYNKNYPPVN